MRKLNSSTAVTQVAEAEEAVVSTPGDEVLERASALATQMAEAEEAVVPDGDGVKAIVTIYRINSEKGVEARVVGWDFALPGWVVLHNVDGSTTYLNRDLIDQVLWEGVEDAE